MTTIKASPHLQISIVACALILTAWVGSGCNDSSSTPDTQPIANSTPDPTPTPVPPARTVLMGFTPWPYAATIEAIEWVYQNINSYGDIISHHIEEGVPWYESYNQIAFHQNYIDSINQRLNHTLPTKKVFLSLSPVNTARNGLADYRGASVNMPLQAPWDTFQFDDAIIKGAYYNYVMRMIDLFHPNYLAIGVEVNLLVRNNPSLWSKYVELHKYIYQNIKAAHPDLQVTATFDVNALLEGYTSVDDHEAQISALNDLSPYIDFFGASVHPILSNYHADSLPSDFFDKIYALTTKPVAITESSYTAQVWSLSSAPSVIFEGSPEKQNDFVSRLLTAAETHKSPFVIYFTIRDYDDLWVSLGSKDDSLPWRDTGLFDENGTPRSALKTWQDFFSR